LHSDIKVGECTVLDGVLDMLDLKEMNNKLPITPKRADAAVDFLLVVGLTTAIGGTT
jgi:hypothetical protein